MDNKRIMKTITRQLVYLSIFFFGLLIVLPNTDALVCEYQHSALINEKTRILCETDYKEDMTCIVSISDNNGVYDVQPKKELSLIVGVVDSFFADNGIVNIVIDPSSLIAESNYSLIFDCVSYPIGSNHEQYSDTITYDINRGRLVYGYSIWIGNNVSSFLAIFTIIFMLVVGLVLFGLKDFIGEFILKYMYWGLILVIVVSVATLIFNFMNGGVL